MAQSPCSTKRLNVLPEGRLDSRIEDNLSSLGGRLLVQKSDILKAVQVFAHLSHGCTRSVRNGCRIEVIRLGGGHRKEHWEPILGTKDRLGLLKAVGLWPVVPLSRQR